MNETTISKLATDQGPLAHESDGVTRWLALGGVIGPVVFVLMFTLAGVLRPGYSPIHQAVSDLGVGSNPWLLNGPLVLLGLLLTAFVVGFDRGVGTAIGGAWRWVCVVLLALPGFGYAVGGIFTEAPATVAIHWMVGMPLLAVGSVVGFLVTGLRLRRQDGWRGWGIYSVSASVATLVLIGIMFWVFTPSSLLGPLQLGGLLERILFLEILAWYLAFGWRLSRKESPSASATPVAGRDDQRV
jgi:hypothetical membrane protein